MRRTIGSVVVAVMCAASAFAADPPIRLYVFTGTDPSGLVDKDTQVRQDAVQDVRKALTKRKGIVLAESLQAADLIVEILQAGKVDTGKMETTPGLVGVVSRPRITDYGLDARLRVPSMQYETPFSVTNASAYIGKPKSYVAADKLSKEIEQWIKTNRSKLPFVAAP